MNGTAGISADGGEGVNFDVKRVRAAYPALSDGFAYLDGAAGTQVPTVVIDAIADAYRAGLGNVGGTSAASNVVGTRPDLAAIAAAAHAVGALVYVDGVHATPHVPVDVTALGADFYATSAYKWSGPHIGTVVAEPALLDSVHPDKLAPAPSGVPGRFERGTAAFADLAGVVAAVEHLASLGHGPDLVAATRRQRVLTSMATVEEYETQLFTGLLDG